MVKIALTALSKRYQFEWIFKSLNIELSADKSYAIIGPNGSGKSTLLQVIAGSMPASEGQIKYLIDQKEVTEENIYQYVAYAAPYLELIEEFTLAETLDFHFKFKQAQSSINIKDIPRIAYLEDAIDRPIKQFSSGMKQRVKLCLSILSNSPILLLDEPTANLDAEGTSWYQELIKKYRENRLVIVASNELREYDFCEEKINILDFK